MRQNAIINNYVCPYVKVVHACEHVCMEGALAILYSTPAKESVCQNNLEQGSQFQERLAEQLLPLFTGVALGLLLDRCLHLCAHIMDCINTNLILHIIEYFVRPFAPHNLFHNKPL